jgi:hypothetical protein
MLTHRDAVSEHDVRVPVSSLRQMVAVVRALTHLSHDPLYRQKVYDQLPRIARFDPGHDAVMMCYDFHLAGDQPRLIEVNTNAGGSLLAYLACYPSENEQQISLPDKLRKRLVKMFSDDFTSYALGEKAGPEHMVIMDEAPQEQHLYPEMCAFADMLSDSGIRTEIVEPKQLHASPEGVWLNDRRIDMIYNRHCDFYLESSSLAHIKQAYLSKSVCLSPNPHLYGLLADKRRMILWSNPVQCNLWQIADREKALLKNVVPKASLLADFDKEKIWGDRKKYVFKPVDSFGSKGVLLGDKMSRTRFEKLPPKMTLVQELIPPSLTPVDQDRPMKTDLRLYAYRERVLGLTARLYHGQVTNLRTPGGGFARVRTTGSH